VTPLRLRQTETMAARTLRARSHACAVSERKLYEQGVLWSGLTTKRALASFSRRSDKDVFVHIFVHIFVRIFVHISAVERAGMGTLNEGQRVPFDIVATAGPASLCRQSARHLTRRARNTMSL
jgi:cold shock CspA family protein